MRPAVPPVSTRADRVCSAVAGALLLPAALAQTVPDTQLRPVVVIGARASLATAQKIRQDSLEIVDSVVADDIVKLPDTSVTDALQRVTGVQIARDRGEGTSVTIRGLAQMETLLDGREVFTAGVGRTVDFTDFAAETVAGIDVYKTSSAAQIEGGLGGTIDLRRRRPFDFAGGAGVVSLRAIHGDLVQRTEPQVSLLATRRWKGGGGGEFGALLDLSFQRRAYREDQKSAGTPSPRTDLIAGQTVFAPTGTSETVSAGRRDRGAAHLVLQWRPSPRLQFDAEANLAELRTIQDSHQINVLPRAAPSNPAAGPVFVPGTPVLFEGTSDLRSITWTDAPVSILSFARDTLDRTRQLAVGGRWSQGDWTVKGDLSRTRSINQLFFSGPILGATAARFTHDVGSGVPATSIAGTDLLDPSAVRFTGVATRTRPFDGGLTATRLDAERQLDTGWLRSLSAGWRDARRSASNLPGLIVADVGVTGLTVADRPGLVMPDPYRFFTGVGSPSLHDFLVGNLAGARDASTFRDAFGVTTPIPASANPLSLWTIAEHTEAAYLMAVFQWPGAPVDGNAGLRVVRTRESVSGSQSVPATGGLAPIDVDTRTTDWLPSVNLRWRPADGWVLRAAVSRTLTRPNFDQLSPSLTLLANPINPSLNQGAAGNPALAAIRADNLDFAVERYLGPTTSLLATVFAKKVDGFITTVAAPEVHDGLTYLVSRPQNSDTADIRGIELAGQHFFERLPGFGVQANYTTIDSQAPNNALGIVLPLQNLSRHSVNLVAIYERGPVSARMAWNWRDRFLSGIVSVVGVGVVPIYTQAYGWLDASLRWQASPRVSIALEGANLLRTRRSAYYGTPTRPQSQILNDRQIGVSATVRF